MVTAIAVAGLPGVGKTTWITQQLTTAPTVYVPTTKILIDATYLQAEFPQVQILTQEAQIMEMLACGVSAYIELDYRLDLATTSKLLDTLNCQRVAIVPPDTNESEWHDWADKVVTGAPILQKSSMQVCANTTGEVIDPSSLDVFWYELTQGAYGEVNRAKGIFAHADGLTVYGFVPGIPQAGDFIELNLPRHLTGRPQHFSGIEVWGRNLEENAIAQTLEDCCLSEAMYQYQQQLAQMST